MIRDSGGWKSYAQLTDSCESLDFILRHDEAGHRSCVTSFSVADWLLFKDRSWGEILCNPVALATWSWLMAYINEFERGFCG